VNVDRGHRSHPRAAGSADICVAHLVWAPLGPQVLADFLASYTRHPAAIEHRLAVICNGFSGPDDPRLKEVERALEGIAYERVITPRAVLDIEAYRQAALELKAGRLCFLNSYSRPLADGWLAKLAAPLEDPAIGLAGSGGSFESAFTAAPRWLRPFRRRLFPPFPNPHLRTNGFMIQRSLLLELRWPRPASKVSAWAFESGRASLARQVWERELEVVVVGADGCAYPRERWLESATFRSGGQRNLLIADNRTSQYEQADAKLRGRLELMAWGRVEER
jgi:hypothetical protein